MVSPVVAPPGSSELLALEPHHRELLEAWSDQSLTATVPLQIIFPPNSVMYTSVWYVAVEND